MTVYEDKVIKCLINTDNDHMYKSLSSKIVYLYMKTIEDIGYLQAVRDTNTSHLWWFLMMAATAYTHVTRNNVENCRVTSTDLELYVPLKHLKFHYDKESYFLWPPL